ncbi:hypothetical protein GGS20DRAFT_139687 [Poronia punctata]|nr:hypothetical protein GGS20DRAFT_139687 [Poronia punctata]
MSHPQPAFAQRQFSQPQPTSPSPLNGQMNTSTNTATNASANAMTNTASTTGFAQPPPSKRARMSPNPTHSQPNSPLTYANSPYAPSPPSGAGTPTSMTAPTPNLPSPSLPTNTAPMSNPSNISQVPQTPYNIAHQSGPPNGNGRHPSIQSAQASQIARANSPMPSPPPPPSTQYSAQTMPQYRPPTQPSTPVAHSPSQFSNAMLVPTNVSTNPMPVTGNMGPPTIHPSSALTATNEARQASKPAPSTKNASYEVNDMLMGTGIDLDEEAEFMNNFETRTGFPHLPAQGGDSFYGAGPANQPAEVIGGESQEEYAALMADRTWNEAAHRLSVTLSQEIRQHLLEPGILHKRIHDVATKFGLGLNLDLKPDGRTTYMGKLNGPAEFPKPELIVTYKNAPDGTVASTCGSFIPKESYLVDQIALLSIGTKERIGGLLSDANNIALTRQKSAHGAVPPAWADAAAPPLSNGNTLQVNGLRTGAESAVSPRTNPLKRPADEISNNGLPTPVSETSSPNYLIESVLASGKQAQDLEEARLRKRQKRLEKSTEKDKEGAEGGSRSGSVAPGTPGSVAGDGDTKALSKKESKKAAAKAAENSSGTTVNATLSLFTGGKKKKYSWMSSGAGSGAGTPRAQGGSGAPGTPGGTPSKAGRGPLTKASVTHLGQFREDSIKGRNIQLRDWIVALEDRGMDPRSLQVAYAKVDKSDMGDKVATEKE